ncbi:YchF/TatD family DNA exonuclease, partial [Candidatus Sumerlaeota bacterium]|nr:YchF/TatD family DNA exonuclease [Candidatus Sumerlaeota bacterium]
MNLLIDSHAHLTDVAFRDDLVDVLERAALSGIDRVIAIAETLDDAERACGLARQFDMLAATAGVHPHKADSWSEQSAERLASMVSSGRFVAVGEIGLDYHYNFSDRENQKRAFVEQLRIARKSGLPVVVHCREAYDVLTEILSAETPLPAGVIHCFIGTASDARELLAMGFHIGIGGAVTFRKADRLRQIVAEVVPLNRLLLETDSPYLAPEPVRGHRNEPAHLCRIAEAVAAVKSADLARLASATRRNAMELFHLGPELPPTSIAYTLRNSLYLNITNRCTNDCVFCARTRQCALAGYELRLEREPSVAEIIAAIGEKPDTCDEVVFCGYGEPTFRREAILWVGRWLKARGVRRVRLNTNGHGNALHGRSIVGELAEVVDAVSVSLNASDEDDYRRLCQ